LDDNDNDVDINLIYKTPFHFQGFSRYLIESFFRTLKKEGVKIKMSKTILDKGLDYVLENGTELERWNAKRLLNVNEELPSSWAAKQNQDGGWNSKEFKSTVSNMGTTSVTLMRLLLGSYQQNAENIR
jgi:hypothetical protein